MNARRHPPHSFRRILVLCLLFAAMVAGGFWFRSQRLRRVAASGADRVAVSPRSISQSILKSQLDAWKAEVDGAHAQVRRLRSLLALIADPANISADLVGEAPLRGRVVLEGGARRALAVIVFGLPEPNPTESYQVWAELSSGGISSLGVLPRQGDEFRILLVAPPESLEGIRITRESARGADEPSADVLLTQGTPLERPGQ